MTTRLNQIERACVDLTTSGQPITIVAVADISRPTIHRNEGVCPRCG